MPVQRPRPIPAFAGQSPVLAAATNTQIQIHKRKYTHVNWQYCKMEAAGDRTDLGGKRGIFGGNNCLLHLRRELDNKVARKRAKLRVARAHPK